MIAYERWTTSVPSNESKETTYPPFSFRVLDLCPSADHFPQFASLCTNSLLFPSPRHLLHLLLRILVLVLSAPRQIHTSLLSSLPFLRDRACFHRRDRVEAPFFGLPRRRSRPLLSSFYNYSIEELWSRASSGPSESLTRSFSCRGGIPFLSFFSSSSA